MGVVMRAGRILSLPLVMERKVSQLKNASLRAAADVLELFANIFGYVMYHMMCCSAPSLACACP